MSAELRAGWPTRTGACSGRQGGGAHSTGASSAASLPACHSLPAPGAPLTVHPALCVLPACATGLGIPLATLDEQPKLDVAIDGADEVDAAVVLWSCCGHAAVVLRAPPKRHPCCLQLLCLGTVPACAAARADSAAARADSAAGTCVGSAVACSGCHIAALRLLTCVHHRWTPSLTW